VRQATAEELTADNYSFILGVDFFGGQPEDVLRELSAAFEKARYGRHEEIVREGEEGASFFIITRGRVAVIREGELIAELGRGDFFGEMSLLTGRRRNATVKALQDTDCLMLDKVHFREILLRHDEMVEKIGSVISEREESGQQILGARRTGGQQDEPERQPATAKERVIALMRMFFNI